MRREQIRENNRKALIAAAVADIAEHGYQAAKLGEIAERAHLTTGAVYSIFGSKRALLVAATRQTVEDFNESLRPLADPVLSLTEVLDGYVAAMLGPADGRAHERFAFELETMAAALRDPRLMAEIEAEVPQALPLLTELLTDRRADSGIRTTAAQAARMAPAVEALLSGFAQHGNALRPYVDRDYVRASAVALTALIAT
ncbi:TetR family transcriptional regulator [Nocardia sp. NPDC052566]|uniref:TetR family transcriptional regulator n=1 Tax=Nocardia sp. NPDC052566 TaxID=3364330 RepID=UPI0037CC783F